MQHDDEEEHAASDVDLVSSEDHGDGPKLADKVDHDEQGGDEPAAAPGDVHVLPLLAPLNPHTHPILEECGHKAKSGDVRKDVFGMSGHL